MIALAQQPTPRKPREGEPCNGCGLCCALEPCRLAQEFLNVTRNDPCPALELEAGRYWCGLVRSPGKYLGQPSYIADSLVAAFGLLLGVGRGCDSNIAGVDDVGGPP